GELVITLSAALKPVSVSGKVDGIDAAVLAQGITRVVMVSPAYAGNINAAVRPDGTFEFPSVYPGSYVAQIPSLTPTRGSLVNPTEIGATGIPGGLLPAGIPLVPSLGTTGVAVTVTDSDITNLNLS